MTEPKPESFLAYSAASGFHRIAYAYADEVKLEDAFLIQPTSGSSGRPKLVLRSHYGFSRYAQFVGDQARRAFPRGYRPRMLAVNALTHAFAGHMMTMALRLGLEIAVPTDIDIAVALHEVRELDPDVLPMTPRVLRSLARQHMNKDEPESAPLFGERARVLLSAGGKGDPQIFQQLVDGGMEVLEFYGSSEASIVALTPCGGWKKGCAGKPVPDVDFRFSRDREILVRSPGIMLGYYGDEELTSLVVDGEGFYHTGDLGSIDEGGYLRIDGRKRDLFNTPEGTNIYPERIEILIESLSYVKQAILVGDCLPYLTVHIVLNDHESNGLLDEEKAADAYRSVGKDLSEINDDLETIEQIVAFALYGSPFESDVYQVVTAGKVRRDRPRFYHKYAKPIRRLYSHELHHRSEMLVPPKERRFRKRQQGAR